MKKCNHCGADVPEEETVCPACGQEVTEETASAEEPTEQTAPEETAAQTSSEVESFTCEEEPEADGAEQTEDAQAEPAGEAQETAPEKSRPSALVWVIGALAVVAIVAAIFLAGKKSAAKPDADAPAESGVTETTDENAQNAEDAESAESFVSYTVTQDELTDEVLAKVVASCGDQNLTNRDLAFYYWQQYYTFVNNYGSYLSYIMDTSKGLDEQAYSEDQTWQQAFLDSAVTMFHSMTAINLEADKAGFELGEEDQAQLDAIPESLDATAGYYGMEDGLAYLQRVFGPSVTVEDYVAFVRDSMRASRYMELLVEQMEFSDAEISDFYDQHAEDYAQSRIEKIDEPMVSVRHILVIPTEQNEDGTYTDEAWAEAEQKAQALLDEWKAGEATEDSFAALANENSEDPGSSSSGGLYEDVYPGQMVDPFDEWCFDDARKAGDTGIVKTDYGYHVMYYVSKGEAVFWFEAAKSDLQTERENALEESIRAQYPLTENLENAAIFDVQAEDRAAANAAAEAAANEAASEETGTDASEDTAAQEEAGE